MKINETTRPVPHVFVERFSSWKKPLFTRTPHIPSRSGPSKRKVAGVAGDLGDVSPPSYRSLLQYQQEEN